MQRFGVGDWCSWRRKFQLHPLSFIVQSSAGDGVVDEPALHRRGAAGRGDVDVHVDVLAEGGEEPSDGSVTILELRRKTKLSQSGVYKILSALKVSGKIRRADASRRLSGRCGYDWRDSLYLG